MNCITVSLKSGVRTLQFNNPKKKNVFNVETFRKIAEILTKDVSNDDVSGTILTGTGDYFTSGSDLSLALNHMNNVEGAIGESLSAYKEMTETMIRYPKLLAALVNGPAIGIGATMCGLCDLVYATENATFTTPFVKLGISIEACASVLFPKIMGSAKANEMLLLGRTFTAKEALQANLVCRVIPQADIESFKEDLHKKIGELNVAGFINNKKLMKESTQQELLETFLRENIYIEKSLKSESFMKSMLEFAKRKKNA
ncbi:PREDICTED: enoyl-CoA delta isomerase 2, mitochondrial-like [Nicrophorus vespilloides]|uniref:Enoyl-CoA delta isomerase 2, mitochondrial-like n=1 Tax=Nicrophorus vespilloides TaxID=110193 RepID=A0ABM1MZV9_NICVS|nr:PREDICTED: enoyl-CoA delta isomerase 2, mitochondrial-like [Nicrophorus vespilloides]